ncbi:small RNA 2 -O-methyltransferase-like [Brachionus plicatilis]|uniref:Small RNA 2'-O-methyltransferase n=1 Tax=Brachionus plicatilis TaxID=10195 RepID=A0A3M7PH48_BRAPC|nr:small RNA 2 -O-methyltransferase-like [Brachionus plicatilis]
MTDPLSNFEEIDCKHHFSSDDLSSDQNKRLCFDPPLYIQRYNYVSGLLFDFKCKSVMDIGCAECKLIHLLKQTNQNLNLIIGLDLDESVLEKNKSKFSDNLVDMFHCRENPLDMYLVKVDISKPDKYFLDKFCSKSCGLDFVSMVEIIEHMYPETLQDAIETVFMQLRPKYVLISTPNSEFNVVFGENSNPYDERKIDQKFRHWDHKFEWTRDEFRKWCKEKILDVYQDYKLYNNSFHGLAISRFNHI